MLSISKYTDHISFEKKKEVFYFEKEKMVSNAVGGCDGFYNYSDDGICSRNR